MGILDQIAKAKGDLNDSNFRVSESYTDDFGACGLSQRSYPVCFINQTVPVVGADQKIYDCHNRAYHAGGEIGSIKDRSFTEVWFSQRNADLPIWSLFVSY